jgi:diguanylate cyclase (GGDEF)-like protein
MTVPEEKDAVLRDYAAFLKALLPQAQGFICHDSQGRVFWSEAPPEGVPTVTDEYRELLALLLNGGALPPEGARLRIGPHIAFLAPLRGEDGRMLGVLNVLADRGAASMPYPFVMDLAAPALRSLQRELSLRYRLLDGQRKLQVQAAEERLLHTVETLLHDRHQPCERALARIVALCCEHLDVAGAWLVIPDKHLALVHGTGVDMAAARQASAGLLAVARDPEFDANTVSRQDEWLWLGIRARGQGVQGILAFTGWQGSRFSERRLARIARYVGSHIDSLLDRNYDSLTGLLAWPVFERELAAAATDRGSAVLAIDVDRLHLVNETFGREVGDEVLVRLAGVLHDVLPGHALTRVAGDQFAALLRNTGVEEARRLGDAICARFREHCYERGDQTHRPSVSIGVGSLGEGVEAGAEMGGARVALQAAKDRGRGRTEVYESADASIVKRFDDIQIVGYVRNAIENNRLALVAQPLTALKPGRVPDYSEVLVRIVDDAGQHVPPGDFMSAAERYQLMEELDRWVVATTLRLLAEHGPHLVGRSARFAINLSGQSLGSETFLPFVEAAVKASGVPADIIAFEITESVAVARMQQAQAFMHAMRNLGCHFSLDDFGTGLSSFAYLKLFPVDTLKIDGSFVRDVTTNVVSQSVVAAIAEVARVMQLETVAEFVQDQASLDLLRKLNISYAQGFFVGATELLSDKITALDAVAARKPGRQAPAAR